MDGRSSPRLEEQINRSDKRNAVPKMMQNGDVKGDGGFKVAETSLLKQWLSKRISDYLISSFTEF